MALDLSDVKAKLRWADQHLGRLDKEITRYQKKQVYVPVAQPYAEPNVPPEKRSVFVVATQVRRVPGEIALTAGDVLYNLRATLDYLARALVLAEGKLPIDKTLPGQRRTDFRICRVEPGNLEKEPLVSPYLGPGVTALLDGFQPYKCRHVGPVESHPLWLLEEFNNTDKHRHLNVVPLAISGGKVTLTLPDGSTIVRSKPGALRSDGSTWQRMALEDGSILTVFSAAELAGVPLGEAKIECDLAIDVTLGPLGAADDDLIPLREQLGRIRDYVRKQVLPKVGFFYSH